MGLTAARPVSPCWETDFRTTRHHENRNGRLIALEPPVYLFEPCQGAQQVKVSHPPARVGWIGAA